MWDDQHEIVQADNSALDITPQASLGAVRVRDQDSPLALMVGAAAGITRSPKALIGAAKQIGELMGADAFYRFPTGGAQVEGVSINLAQALAQAWGAIAYQVRIMSVEPLASGGRKVHLRATVTDLKSLVAAEVDQVVSTSAPPGKFAKNAEQSERWHTMQTQSAASKIVRNAILRVLPSWYVDAAFVAAVNIDAQNATNGKSLPDARRDAEQHMVSKFGLTRAELEAFVGQPVDLWAAPQLGQIRDLASDLKHARTSVEQVRQTLSGEAAPARPTGKSALGLTTSAKKPDGGDDDPPTRPTGTDGVGAGEASSDDADARAFEAYQQSQANGAAPQATVREIRVVRDEPVMRTGGQRR